MIGSGSFFTPSHALALFCRVVLLFCFLQLRGQGPHRHREWLFGAEKAGVGMGGSSGSSGHRLLTSWWEMLRPVQWTDGDRWGFNIAENERIRRGHRDVLLACVAS